MKLLTILRIKKLLRKALLYSLWPHGMRRVLKGIRDDIWCRWKLHRKGITIYEDEGLVFVGKDGKKIIVGNEVATSKEQISLLLSSFEKVFCISGLRFEDRTIDFTREISLGGFLVKTTFVMALEYDIMRYYNRYYALKEGDIVFDCGAFHGIYALMASKLVGETGRVFCFEPDNENAKMLEANILRNGIRNVSIVRKGVWSLGGGLPFNFRGAATSCVDFRMVSRGGGAGIEVVSIPEFFRENGLETIDFVKMDIEGAEIEVIEGCREFLRSHGVMFAIASYHLRDGQETYRKLERLFGDIGYGFVTEVTETITTYAWPKEIVPLHGAEEVTSELVVSPGGRRN